MKKNFYSLIILNILLGYLILSGCSIPNNSNDGDSSNQTLPKSSEKKIQSFYFTSPAAIGTINETNHTIVVTVPYGTNVTALSPVIVQTGSSIAPASGAAVNFTTPFTYTVTAANGTTQAYIVTVTQASSNVKAITSFSFASPATTGIINESAHTIAVSVPYGTDVTALVPTIVQTGASIAPASGTAQNFTNPFTYTVTAADGSTQVYSVLITPGSSTSKAIQSFYFSNPIAIGTINETNHTIAVTVPYGTNVTALSPVIVQTGSSIAPASGAAENFTNPFTYTVTAANGSTQGYVVTVTVAPLNSYTITFDKNSSGATGYIAPLTIPSGSTQNLTLNAFTKAGWTFIGWATTSTGGATYLDRASFTMGSANVTLYAKWAANNYTITFDKNDSSATGSMSAQTIACDSTADITLQTFNKIGWTFSGWATTQAGAVSFADGGVYTMGPGNVTLYAKWTANNYTITFDKNDSGATGSMSVQTIAYGATQNLTLNVYSKTGWSFTGWATTSTGGVAYADGASYTMGPGNVILYAQWTANNYTISFDKDDAAATGNMSNQTIACESSANLLSNAFTNTGYVFAGWATTSGGSVIYANNASYTMGASNVTLYAVWGNAPTVTTMTIAASQSGDNKFGNIGLSTNITGTGAQGGGTVTSDNRATVTERGVCWNTTGSPTISGPHSASGGGGTGDFTADMTGLTANTVYHVRAYAINSIGTSYGNEVTFNSGYTIGSIHDGGYVFYNDGNGRGMVAAMSDLANAAFDDGARWNSFDIATSSLFGMGQKNTIDMSNDTDGINHTYPAANACHNYTDGTYHDWFLPSVDELMLMITHLNANGGGFVNDYWSSSTGEPTWAYFVLQNGNSDQTLRKMGLSIRPARIFGF